MSSETVSVEELILFFTLQLKALPPKYDTISPNEINKKIKKIIHKILNTLDSDKQKELKTSLEAKTISEMTDFDFSFFKRMRKNKSYATLMATRRTYLQSIFLSAKQSVAEPEEAAETHTSITQEQESSGLNTPSTPSITSHLEKEKVGDITLTLLDCGLTGASANLNSDISAATAEMESVTPRIATRRLAPKQLSQHPHWARQFSPQRHSSSSATSVAAEQQFEFRNA